MHFLFISVFTTTSKFQQRPCLHVKFLSIIGYGHLSASVVWGKGKCVAPIDRLTLFDICSISCSDCHSLRAFSTARYSQHSSYFTRMGLLVKCGLAALRRHLALPPYESSIRVLKVREFVNSIFPAKFSRDRLFYSTNHRRGPSIMRSRDLF